MIKSAIKSILANSAYYSGMLLLRQRSEAQASQAIILMYHRVLPPVGSREDSGWERYRSLPGIVVTPETFEAQLQFLAERNNVISLSELIDCLESGAQLPLRATVITFDDGWRDNYAYAFPILKKFRLPATIFLTAGFVDTTRVFWPERVIGILSQLTASVTNTAVWQSANIPPALAVLIGAVVKSHGSKRIGLEDQLINAMKDLLPDARERLLGTIEKLESFDSASRDGARVMLDWREIKEMQAGGISFGSHGVSHELLTQIDRTQVEQELRESRRLLETKLDFRVDTLAYPNGNFNDAIKQIALAAGYRCAVTVLKRAVNATSDRFALGRINIHEGCSQGVAGGFSRALFACHLQRFPY